MPLLWRDKQISKKEEKNVQMCLGELQDDQSVADHHRLTVTQFGSDKSSPSLTLK